MASNTSAESPWLRKTHDATSMTLYAKTTSTWEQMSAWLEKTFPEKGWRWRGFGEVGEEGFCVVLILKECEDDEKDEDEEDEEQEECDQCNEVLDDSTGREWIAELGCLCSECYELRKDDFPKEKE